MIRALIVDDEPLARELIRSLLAETDYVEVVGECSSGRAAVAAMNGGKIDLVFLDVQMPGWSGLDALDRVHPDHRPHVVFVTAHDKYAIRAFDVSAVDYVLKPIDKERFRTAVRRARLRIETGDRQIPQAILVRDGVHLDSVPVVDIQWIEAANQYARIHTATGVHLISRSLSTFDRDLACAGFVRIHRSALVNTAHVVRVDAMKNGACDVLLTSGQRLTLSRRRRAHLEALLSGRS